VIILIAILCFEDRVYKVEIGIENEETEVDLKTSKQEYTHPAEG
jgi:hypothetical protein